MDNLKLDKLDENTMMKVPLATILLWILSRALKMKKIEKKVFSRQVEKPTYTSLSILKARILEWLLAISYIFYTGKAKSHLNRKL